MHKHRLLTFAILAASVAMAPAAAVAQTPAPPPAAPPASKPATADTKKPATAPPQVTKGVRTVEIVGTDDMKFSVTAFDAKPGEQVRIRLISKGTMPKAAMAHNVVVLKTGASQVKFVQEAAQHRATDFIPPTMKDQVVAATALAGPGETVEVTFKVPTAPGEYPYLCTFPGHFQVGMRGTMTVKK